jgi:hypothetical protein
MIKKISTILLSLLMVWYAAGQVRGEKTQEKSKYGVQVSQNTRTEPNSGEEIYGQIRATAALRKLLPEQEASARFVLKGDSGTYVKTVTVTPDSWDEHDLLSASAVFMDLDSGEYLLKIDKLRNAKLDYILAENGDDTQYCIEDEMISFTLSHDARLGSAWFILEETGGGNR